MRRGALDDDEDNAPRVNPCDQPDDAAAAEILSCAKNGCLGMMYRVQHAWDFATVKARKMCNGKIFIFQRTVSSSSASALVARR